METTVIPLQELVTSLSINPNGHHAVLAAKRGLFLLDLTDPFRSPIAFKHATKWEVLDVSWNPHKEHSNWIASTQNQNVEIILHSHKRAVSDFHWSPFKSDRIATCGYDNFVHVWDLRTRSGGSGDLSDDGMHGETGAPGRSGLALVLTKPSMSFCSWTCE
ncbi:hypothetical protein HDU98_000260 [Podochytrium sp. JEL0797]|nr:hypothetical protein HDU98_000260 [Podochytrium sp. JEL0797]